MLIGTNSCTCSKVNKRKVSIKEKFILHLNQIIFYNLLWAILIKNGPFLLKMHYGRDRSYFVTSVMQDGVQT